MCNSPRMHRDYKMGRITSEHFIYDVSKNKLWDPWSLAESRELYRTLIPDENAIDLMA